MSVVNEPLVSSGGHDSRWGMGRLSKVVTLLIFGLFGVLSIVLSFAPQKAAAVSGNYTLNFQARLLTSSGSVVPDGSYNIDFRLYNTQTGSLTGTGTNVGTCTGACLWEETRTNAASHGVSVVDGYFSVNLGSVTPFSTTINWNQPLWLTMNLTTNGTQTGAPSSGNWNGEMQNGGNDIALTAVPSALTANTLGNVVSSYQQILQFATSFGQATTITLPDPGSGTAAVCYQNAAAACGYAPSATNGYIQLAPSGAQGDSSTVSSIFVNKTGSSGDVIELQKSGSDVLAVSNSGNLTVNSSATSGGVGVGSSSNGSEVKLDGSGTHHFSILNAAGTLEIGTSDSSSSIGATVTTYFSINGGSGAVTLQTASGDTIQVGNQSGSTNNTINVGDAGSTTNTDTVNINNTSGANGSTITLGGSGNATGQITIGQATTGSETISIASANQTAATQTVSIAAGTSTTSGGETVNIANGLPGSGTINSINIGNSAGTTGTTTVTVGSIGATSNNTTVIQGGSLSTGVGAVSIQAAASGLITLGTTNANTINIGNSSGNSVAVASGNSNISLTTNGATASVIAKSSTNNVNAFEIQGSAGSSATLLNADTVNSRIGIDNGYTVMPVPTSLSASATAGTGFTSGQTYKYEVTAIDSVGGETGANSNGVQTCSPTGSNLQCSLSWTGSTGASGYRVYRTTNGGSTEEYLTTVLATSFIDTNSMVLSSTNLPVSATAAYYSSNNSTSLDQLSIGGEGTPTGQVYISGTQPTLVGNTTADLSSTDYVAVEGNYEYVVDSTADKLIVFDISNPADPTPISATTLGGSSPDSIAISGHYAYILISGTTLAIYNIADPFAPVSVGSTSNGLKNVWQVYVQGDYAYVGDANNGLVIFNVTNPANPVLASVTNTGFASSNGIQYLYVQGSYAYASNNGNNSIVVFNVANPYSPSEVGSSSTSLTQPRGIYVSGRYAYVATFSGEKLVIFDVSNPASPTETGSISSSSNNLQGVVVQGNYAYTVGNPIQVYNVANPYNPTLISTVSSAITYTIAVQGRYAYVGLGGGIETYDLGGEYTQQLEAGGAEVGTLQVDNNGAVGGDFNVQGGLSVGESIQTAGNLGVVGGSNLQGSVVLAGGNNQLSPPTGPGIVFHGSTSCSGGGGSWTYVITALNASGAESPASSSTNIACSSSNLTLSTSNYNTISWTASSGATSYNIYRTGYPSSGSPSPNTTGLIGSSTTTSFSDMGYNGSGNSAPTINTTGQLTDEGSALFQNTTNSSTAFAIQDSSGDNYVQVDTNGANLYLGNTGIASTVQLGNNTTNSVTQTIDIGAASSNTNTDNININNTSGANSGTVSIGGSGSTGTITLGQGSNTNTINIGSAITGSSQTQTINLGTSTGSSSTTNVNIGSYIGGTTQIQSANGLTLGNTGSSSGSIQFDYSGASSNNVTLQLAANPSSSFTLQLPTAIAGSRQCLVSGLVSGSTVPLGFASCTSGSLTTVAFSNSGNTNGGSISGSTLTLNAATASDPGGVSTTTQSFAGSKTFTADTIIQDSSTTAFTIQNTTPYNLFVADTNDNVIKIYDDVNGGTGYLSLSYNSSTSTATIAASGTGVTSVGNGNGPITLIAGTGSQISITANASSDWQTTAGNLTVDAASSSSILIGTANNNETVTFGTTGSATLSSAVNIQNTSSGTGTQTFTLGNSNNASNAVTISAGNTGKIQIGNTTSANTIQIGAGGTAAGNSQNVTIGSPTTSTNSRVLLQGGAITTSSGVSGVFIGNTTTGASLVPFELSSDSDFSSDESGSNCTTTINQGAMYYNTASNTIRACLNGAWVDLVSTDDLGIIDFGVVSDSGTSANQGDLPALITTGVTGPCKVSWASASSVTVAPCIAYSGGRRVVVSSSTTLATSTASGESTTNIWTNVCLSGSSGAPVFTTAGSSQLLTGAGTSGALYSNTAPVECLATVKLSATTGGNIAQIYDTRTFTDTIKEYVTASTAVADGMVAQASGVSVVPSTNTAGTADQEGVVVASNDSTSSTTPNAIIATSGPAYVIAGAGTAGNNVVGGGGGTAGFSTTNTTTTYGPYAYLGISRTTWAGTCTTAATCLGSLYVDLTIR